MTTHARLTRTGALAIGLGLLVATLATYAGSLANGPVWDDRPLVVDNPNLGTFVGLGRIMSSDLWTASAQGEPSSFYRPFTMFTFWLNVVLGGRSSAWLRLGNVLIHAANAVLLAIFARSLKGVGLRPALLVALLFVVAPVCSEPVLWISGRFDLLVVTFALLALLASRVRGNVGLALGLASVSAGLLCKESFMGWLPILLLDDVFLRRCHVRALLPKHIAVAILAVAYLALRTAVGIPSLDAFAQTDVSALVASFLFLVEASIRELVWPDSLDPFRPYVRLPLGELVAIASGLAALFAGAILFFRRHEVNSGSANRSDGARVGVFGLVWFVFATLPSAVVGPTLSMVGDRYAYLPLVGLFLASLPLITPRGRRGNVVSSGIVSSGIVALVAVAWAACTSLHARAWRDDHTLAVSSLASSPGNPYALYWLGSEAAQRGDLVVADDLLGQSLARNPGSWRTANAICYLRLNQERTVEAEVSCKTAIGLQPRNPRAWVNLASVYVRTQRWREALESAEHAVSLKARYPEAHYLAGVSAANLGQLALASSHVETGLRTDPAYPKLLDLHAALTRARRSN